MISISSDRLKSGKWQTVVILALGFWLSASLLLDLVVMPGLYTTGMMTQAGFATAGYAIFWTFNRLELICAALVLTGLLVIRKNDYYSSLWRSKGVILSAILLTVALIYTYILTPQMSGLGMQLDLFNSAIETPAGMTQMHQFYWVLEAAKLFGIGTLITWQYKQQS